MRETPGKRHYTEYYDQHMIEMVRIKLNSDLNTFGYGFGISDDNYVFDMKTISFDWEKNEHISDNIYRINDNDANPNNSSRINFNYLDGNIGFSIKKLVRTLRIRLIDKLKRLIF